MAQQPGQGAAAGSLPPTTFTSLEAAALRHPDKTALADGADRRTYGQVRDDIVRFTRALRAAGVRRGDRVAVSRPSFMVHVLLTLACENLGAATASISAEEQGQAGAMLTQVDWALSELPLAGVRVVALDRAFLHSAAAIDPHDGLECPSVALAPDEGQRIVRSSGSTGGYKLMLFTRQVQEYWIASAARSAGYMPGSVLMLASPITINVGFARACACLRSGATVVNAQGAAADIAEATHLWALPMHLEQLLDALPADAAARPGLQVMTGGGFCSAALRERVARRLGASLRNRYGANEIETISDDLDAAGNGRINQGVSVRIVGDAGEPLATGESGAIEVRTPAMVDGYLGDAGEAQHAFRDGWFHMGDRGTLTGPATIRVEGRHDDLLNVGGIKLAARAIEERLRALPYVRDAAITALEGDAGRPLLGIALVARGPIDRETLARGLAAIDPGMQLQASACVVESLPRTHNGKVDRSALKRLFPRGN